MCLCECRFKNEKECLCDKTCVDKNCKYLEGYDNMNLDAYNQFMNQNNDNLGKEIEKQRRRNVRGQFKVQL